MKLHQLITDKTVLFIEGDRKKEETLDLLLNELFENTQLKKEGIPKNTIYKGLLRRETEQTTGIGKGFAFPHVRLNDLKGTYVLLAVSKKGLNFNSLDDQPVHFIVLSIVPRLNPGILLKSRAAVVAVLNDEKKRNLMLAARTPEQLYHILKETDRDIDKEVLARDIMRPQIHFLHPEMTLFEAARELHRCHSDSLPIIDSGGNLLGELSCHDLFSFKLPEFFNSLHSISFIKHMNPFEKYFEADTIQTVGNLKLKKRTPVINPDATLMEIVFEMTVKNKELLYVTEGSRLLGTIDRYGIIDKILISGVSEDEV